VELVFGFFFMIIGWRVALVSSQFDVPLVLKPAIIILESCASQPEVPFVLYLKAISRLLCMLDSYLIALHVIRVLELNLVCQTCSQ
jgi:hypothetical protein